MIPVWFVLQWFQKMLDEKWKYSWSGAEYGLVSCAGAWVYIYRQGGLYLAHGSNTIWRKYTGEKGKLPAFELTPGEAVFKWRKDGEPQQYVNDGEDDLYHMGCFVGPTDKFPEGAVIEAKGEKYGVVMTSINDGWSHGAKMAKVDYSATDPAATQDAAPGVSAVTVADNGKPVRLRAGAGTAFEILDEVPVGRTVRVLNVVEGWAQVVYRNKTGWMFEPFLDMGAEGKGEAEDVGGDGGYIVKIHCDTHEQALNIQDDFQKAGYSVEVVRG